MEHTKRRSKPDLAQGAQRTSLKEQAEDARSKYRRAEEGLLTRERQPRRLKRSNSERLWGFRNRKLEGKMGHEKLRVSRKEMKGISIKWGGWGLTPCRFLNFEEESLALIECLLSAGHRSVSHGIADVFLASL